ncbi:hypothetical protein [Nonlabens xiamenensis]|uniref:hypothetical protein n=1 Tax=Nonlabens xiamenensis TaxID=2341043 RepID=UPI000F615134|nr:hypothetical protein [Nonlabens xiamenensis]
MEILNQHTALIIILFFMLFGAFMIGYFFGRPRRIVDRRKVEKASEKMEEVSTREAPADEVDELVIQPGNIRATKTRERAGKLSNASQRKIADQGIDFTHMGNGSPDEADDLKQIVGIGRVVEAKLNSIGIYNYSQLARMSDSDMQTISKVIEFFPGRIQRDDWKGQAHGLMQKSDFHNH